MQLIFLYLYGTFDTQSSQNLLISKPLQVELKFESEIKSAKQETGILNPLIASDATKSHSKHVALESSELKPELQESILYSNLSDLLEQERKYHVVSGAGANIFL